MTARHGRASGRGWLHNGRKQEQWVRQRQKTLRDARERHPGARKAYLLAQENQKRKHKRTTKIPTKPQHAHTKAHEKKKSCRCRTHQITLASVSARTAQMAARLRE